MKLAIIAIIAAVSFAITMVNSDQPGPAGFLTDNSGVILTGNNVTDELMAK